MRHVLMVAFHYPPLAGSAGALRARAFVSYLPRSGWQPHVLAPCASVYGETDGGASTPPEAIVHRSWALDARRHLGWKGRYPELAAVPDRWAFWAPSAIATGLAVIRKYPIEAIWSTYPIATSHLIGATLAKMSGLPWIAEFRDPVVPEAHPRMQRWAQRTIERRAINQAAYSVFVTRGALEDCRLRFGGPDDRFALIPNGFDDALEPAGGAITKAGNNRAGPIQLLHSGHLYHHGRNPAGLFKAVALLKERGEADAEQLQIIFRNSQEERTYQKQIDRLNISDVVALEPRVSHRDALVEQRMVDGLLLLQGQQFNRQVPAKLFEYLRARQPVLALIDKDGDTASLLGELGGARCTESDDPVHIAHQLLAFMEELRLYRQDGIDRWKINETVLASYSRVRQTETLAALLEKTTGDRR